MYWGITAATIAALPWKITASWRWYSSHITLCSLVSCLSSVTVVNGVMSGCINGCFSILSQSSVGSLVTRRISDSSGTRDRQPCSPPHILVLRLVSTWTIYFTSLSIDRMVGISLSRGITAALKRTSTMRSTLATGVGILLCVLLLLYSNNSITTLRQWLLIGKVDNVVTELWLFTCTVAKYPSRKKREAAMFHVECGNGYLYHRMGL